MAAHGNTISRTLVDEAAALVGVSSDEVVRDNYSGRGMFGTSCFGLVGPTPVLMGMMAALGTVAQDHADSLDKPDVDRGLITRMAKDAAMDSMGREDIVYFPGWTLAN